MNDKIKGDAVFMVCFPWEDGAIKLEGTNTHVKQSKDIPELINSLANVKSPSDVSVLKEALEKIDNPIEYLQRKAKEEGYELDGLNAVQLSNSAHWLKQIAHEALAQYSILTAPADEIDGSISECSHKK